MTLFNVITTVNKHFPDATKNEICCIVNELEQRIYDEIFSPNGIARPRRKLEPQGDINEKLFLEEENISLYVYFINALLSFLEKDFEGFNSYSALFNEKWEELAAFYRRNFIPPKNTLLKGGI